MSHGEWPALLHHYGYLFVFLLIGLEAAGLPLPGETVMIGASLYAARTGRLGIAGILAVACAGAILGGTLGYILGRTLGGGVLRRFSPLLGLSHDRMLLGYYLVQRHGAWLVVFGRFVAGLRALSALLAGAGRMNAGRFMMANVAGGLLWPMLYCLGAFSFGDAIRQIAGRAAFLIGLAALAAFVGCILFVRRHERRLIGAARLAEAQGRLDAIMP